MKAVEQVYVLSNIKRSLKPFESVRIMRVCNGDNANSVARDLGSHRHLVQRGMADSVGRPPAQVLRRSNVRLFRGHYWRVKRTFDIAVCLLLLPVVLPVMVACGLLVWWESPGDMFFAQLRTGRGGRRFKMLKLRTMVANAEQLKEQFAHLNELSWPDFKITNDPRVTRIGRFLRKTSLDELPQLINVLRGEMSLVGPRPTSFDTSTYSLWHTERLEVLPGITGLWQISGRSDIDFDERLRLDVEYIVRQGFWLDLQILFRTFVVIFSRRGAY